MFAATVDDKGQYRLSIRRIRVINTYHDHNGVPVDITFSSRAKAKACADELNEKTEYDSVFDKYTGLPMITDIDKIHSEQSKVLDIVRSHMERVRKYTSVGSQTHFWLSDLPQANSQTNSTVELI